MRQDEKIIQRPRPARKIGGLQGRHDLAGHVHFQADDRQGPAARVKLTHHALCNLHSFSRFLLRCGSFLPDKVDCLARGFLRLLQAPVQVQVVVFVRQQPFLVDPFHTISAVLHPGLIIRLEVVADTPPAMGAVHREKTPLLGNQAIQLTEVNLLPLQTGHLPAHAPNR